MKTDFAIETFPDRFFLKKGDLTVRDVRQAFYYSNLGCQVRSFDITGRQLKDILNASPVPLAVSNISYRVENGKLVTALIGGEPIDDAKVYRGATTVHFAGKMLEGVNLTKLPYSLWASDTVIGYIARQKSVSPANAVRAVVMQ